MHLHDLWTFGGTLSRRYYALWGTLLLALKYNIDRVIALLFGVMWRPWSYWPGQAPEPAEMPVALAWSLVLASVPFMFAGVALTVRRLRDAGWAVGWTALFFVPLLNLLFFALLVVQPSRSANAAEGGAQRGWWHRALSHENPYAAGAIGVLAALLLGLPITWFSTEFLQEYGYSLFVGTPFLMGFFGAIFHGLARPRSWGSSVVVAGAGIILLAGFLLALAIEGIVCLVMASPIALTLAVAGATAGWLIQRTLPRNAAQSGRLYVTVITIAPLIAVVETRVASDPPLIAAVTVCDIQAAPDVVWPRVVQFTELPRAEEWIFRAGIAHPLRARIEGEGVGAVRYCEFSTGAFVEPITAWEENHRLAFDVVSQPAALEEWTPYSSIHPPHLEGFFRSRRGEFRLEQLPDGSTRLTGTTWYEQRFWPQRYWQLWSDHLIHAIHRRVLSHIKDETEAAPH